MSFYFPLTLWLVVDVLMRQPYMSHLSSTRESRSRVFLLGSSCGWALSLSRGTRSLLCLFLQSLHKGRTCHKQTSKPSKTLSSLPSSESEVQALTWGKLDAILTFLYCVPRPLPSYIPIVGFSKPIWLLVIFFTYSFYPSTHCTQIYQPSARFIYSICSH